MYGCYDGGGVSVAPWQSRALKISHQTSSVTRCSDVLSGAEICAQLDEKKREKKWGPDWSFKITGILHAGVFSL